MMNAIPQSLFPGRWLLDPEHSEVGVTVRHAGISKVHGRFSDVAATIHVGETLASSSVQAVIHTESITTGDAKRDQHLRSGDFLDVAHFPEASFRSTAITQHGESYNLAGELTLHGVTQEVTLALDFNGVAVDPFGATRAGFSARTTISRKAFGLTWNKALETGGFLVGDEMTVLVEVELTQDATA